MKKPILFISGIGLAIILAYTTLSKPRSIVKQFYMAGVRVQHLKSVKTQEGANYIYSTPLRNQETIIDVLDRAGYRAESNNSKPQIFTHQDGPTVHQITVTPKGDSLEIVANFPI